MNIIVDEVLLHLESSLSAKFDYSDVHKSLDFLFRKSLNDSQTENSKVALSSVEAVLEKVWESLHTGSWADAPDGMRKLYSHASLLKAKLLLKTENDERMLKKTIKAIDMGLLMGNAFRNELTVAASLLCKALQQTIPEVPVKLCDDRESNNSYTLHRNGDHVSTLHQPSLETFLRDFLKSKIPVKITGNMEHWPALNKWKDLNYLVKLAGARLVPVEIGSSYADADWSQKLITLEEFINIHVVQEGEKPAYLAQHQLFNQIPELKDDIRVPEYCYLTDMDGVEPDINAWLGPKGTVSPTHYDPKNNFLAQVVGSKNIILYDPKWSEYLYPYDDKFLKNTAQVDPVKPDLCKFPNFSQVKAAHCTLNEGEMLFIPSGWWHRVESLSVSFSVSFWWIESAVEAPLWFVLYFCLSRRTVGNMSTNCDIMDLMKDYGSEFNMSTVMQCVQELKAWQESQHQKLCDNPTMDTLTNEMDDVLRSFDIPENAQENHYDDRLSSYSEIDEELLKKFGNQKDIMSSPASNSRDDLAILSPNKNADNFSKSKSVECNTNIAEDKQLENEIECKTIKPKKPYLKKGTGLARYGLNIEEVKKKTGKLKFKRPILSVPSKIKVPRKCLNQVKPFPKTEFVIKPTESSRLDLKKVEIANSWNRYEPKDFPDNGEKLNNTEQRELRAFEILEERANNSNLNASSPTVCQLLERGQSSKSNKEVPASRLVRSLNFDRINSSTPRQNVDDSDDSYSDSSQECDPLDLTEDVLKVTNLNDDKKSNYEKEVNSVILTENEKKYLENYSKTSGIMKHVDFDQSFDTEILSKRLEELESEIETFRSENTKLMKLQREFEVERQKFFKSKEDFLKKLNDEKKKEEEMLAEERKKFIREKVLFEKNARELRNKPNRQEREEIKKLKEQLTELKEEFNKKEARWATGQARLRTQMKQLENSNTALRSELELFRKSSLNKKVTFKTPSEKQALRNTKIIHNVNRELSKLSPDDISSMIDPKTRNIPASILRKPVITTDNESSEELSSDENQFSKNLLHDSDNENGFNESNGTQRSSCGVVRETVLDDGRKEILYSNGNLKKISSDGNNVKVIYYNGDVKETKDDYERYYFAKNKTYHTTYNSGLEIIEFPNGQTEKHYKDGKVEIEYVDGKKHTVYPDRKEIWNYLDGSVLTVDPNGHRELVLLNGQREIHTSEFKKRVYLDGTTKIVYPDGSHETKYPDGRIRKKDKDGNLTLDTSVSS